MIERLKGWWKGQPHVRFKCNTGGYYVSSPVVPARSILPYWLKKQLEKKNVKFVKCPGMHDQSHQGYLITAWSDIHIKANSQGVIVDMPLVGEASLKAQFMDFDLVDGLAPIREGVAKKIVKLPGPWGIYTKKGYSAYVLPATFHSPFLDKLYVYGGVVDYENFHTVNFIFSPLGPCEFTIPMGTPLLQVIPFKRESMHAETGHATRLESDQHRYSMPTRVLSAYRHLFHKKKVFTMKDVS